MSKMTITVKGRAASPGIVAGRIALDADTAIEYARNGAASILVREFTAPTDIHGMFAAKGFVTLRGGVVSHAAVVARGLNKPCVVACKGLKIRWDSRSLICRSVMVREGEMMEVNGTTGEVTFEGEDMEDIWKEFSTDSISFNGGSTSIPF